MAKKKTVQKRNKPLPGVNPDKPFPPPKQKNKGKKKKSIRKRKNETTTRNDNSSFLTTLELADVLRAENIKLKKGNIFKRFKDWFGNAWFVFFNSYGG